MSTRTIALFGLAALMGAATAGARMSESAVAVVEPARGSAGFICLWAIYATLSEVGKKCPEARNAAVDAELERSVSRLENYARRHSPAGAAFMARYRARTIEGERDALSCNGDAVRMYEQFARVGSEALRRDTDRFLASSPRVEWGDCL